MKKQLIKLPQQMASYDLPRSYQIRKLAFEDFQYTWQSEKTGILVLIHPDCAAELPRPQAQQYLSKIKQITPGLYKKIFVNFFFSYGYTAVDWSWRNMPNYDILVEIRNHLTQISDHVHDTSMGKKSFSGPIGDYLMENDKVVVFMGGGYQDLCLKQSYDNFCSVLNWIIEEQDHEVVIEKQLVFYRTIQSGEFKPNINPWWDEVEVFDDPLSFPSPEDVEKK